jgi:hypothetical protein
MRHRSRVALAVSAVALGISSALTAPVSAQELATTAPATTGASVLASCSYSGSHPTLRYGAKGSAVVHAQCLLNYWGSNLIADGQFGMNTHLALTDFQVRCGASSEWGYIGAVTWRELHPDTSSC